MKDYSHLIKIITNYKYRLGVTYILFILEMGGDLLKPYFIGKAVNDLLGGSFHSLVLFLALHFSWLIIGTIRMRYDTRTYTAIYNAVILQFISDKLGKSNISKLSAHATLTRELVDSLEFDLVFILEALFNVIGSLVLLFFYDVKIVGICLLVLIPISFISRQYGKKMSVLTHAKNNELEKQVNVIGSIDNVEINRHFTAMREWQIKISDQHAFSFGIMESIVGLLIGLSLYIAAKNTGQAINQGELIGIYFYIIKFNKGLETVPYILEKYASIKDILQRLITFS